MIFKQGNLQKKETNKYPCVETWGSVQFHLEGTVHKICDKYTQQNVIVNPFKSNELKYFFLAKTNKLLAEIQKQ